MYNEYLISGEGKTYCKRKTCQKSIAFCVASK